MNNLKSEPSEKPDKLYKYKSLADEKPRTYTSRTITHQAIYFSRYDEFNDPFDCKFTVSCDGSESDRLALAEMVARYESGPDASEQQVQRVACQVMQHLSADDGGELPFDMYEFAKESIGRMGICCFCEVNDHILMWSHYADAHRGICLEFSNLDKNDFRQVTYVSSMPAYNILTLVRPRVEKDEEAHKLLLYKWEHWGYEKEWRMFNPPGPGVQTYQPHYLTGVILGSRISDDDRHDVFKWCSDQVAL